MVRRRSTVRFRKGAPGQRLDLKDPNNLMGPIVGPIGSDSGTAPSQRRLPPGGLCLLKSGDVQSGLGILGLFMTKIEQVARRAPSGASSSVCAVVSGSPRSRWPSRRQWQLGAAGGPGRSVLEWALGPGELAQVGEALVTQGNWAASGGQ
jgi:hypothetical protein